MVPPSTARLRFRQMTEDDLDVMADLLGDPRVMEFYPSPKTREAARAWIEWNEANYAAHGHGLWIVEDHNNTFIGDCGLTWQQVCGRRELEVGYHVRTELQGRGLATEAAAACRDHARSIGVEHLIAIIHPENVRSQRVAVKIGLSLEAEDSTGGMRRLVYGGDL
jgi:RimJ/RimL family protein N-acetyltransferase